jgi:predicted flap endonuclease-1-like 5' DNA nuclease
MLRSVNLKAIEFFPGRIDRDNRVGQAKELADRKH